MNVDRVIDHYVDRYDRALSLALLQALAHPEQGGRGYSIELFDPTIDLDGFEVDRSRKMIRLDRRGLLSKHSTADIAEALRNALETEILKTRASLSSRVGWGSGKVLLGVVEAGVGLVGIIVPEPGTTAAGVVVLTLGANSIVDGFSQLAGANRGHGFNPLAEGSGAMGARLADLADLDREAGRAVGKGVFMVAAISLGAYGSIKVLRVPRQTFLQLGVGGQRGGAVVGRLDLLYGSSRAKDGITILSINNNAGKSILRFVTHNGQLVVNGRIYGVQRVLQHESSGKEILKGLLKLLAHGSKY